MKRGTAEVHGAMYGDVPNIRAEKRYLRELGVFFSCGSEQLYRTMSSMPLY